jgi:hypothetical protein
MRGKVRVCTGRNYIWLEFHGTQDETSHANNRAKKLTYKRITAIHEAEIIAPNQSATKLRCISENASLDKHTPLSHGAQSSPICPSECLQNQKRSHNEGNCCRGAKWKGVQSGKSMGQLTEWCKALSPAIYSTKNQQTQHITTKTVAYIFGLIID